MELFESGEYNSILGNFIILIIVKVSKIAKVSNATIHIFKLLNSNHDWLKLSSSITGWICWTFHEIGEPYDLSKGVCKHTLWSKKSYSDGLCFPTDFLLS